MKNTGRGIGGLFLLQFVAMMLGFLSLVPGVGSDYLQKAASVEASMRAGVMLLMAASALTIAIALVLYPVVRSHSVSAAALLVIVTAFWLVMQTTDDVHILSMLSLSKRFAETAGANADVYTALAAQVRSTRLYVHYAELFAFDVWYAVFFSLLFAYRLVPRWVAGTVGLTAVALHLIGLPIAMFAGYSLIPQLAYALIVAYLAIGGWLLVKGFPNSVNEDQARA